MRYYKLTTEHMRLGRAGVELNGRACYVDAPLVAAWTTLFGPLNHNILLQRLAADAPLSAIEAGSCADDVEERSIAVLQASLRPFDAERGRNRPLHELRCYDLAPGTSPKFMELLSGIMAHREQLSPCPGAWASVTGRGDQVLHIWAYRSLEDREAVRDVLIADPVWNAYSASVIPLIRSQTNLLLKPVFLQ